MTNMTWPPMPEPHPIKYAPAYRNLWLRNAVEAYGRACALAALEAAIRVCEKGAGEYQRTQGRRFPELKDDAETGAEHCESALRKLKDTL